MKISVDDKELFTLSDIQKKVIQDEISSDIFEEDMKRRVHYILDHKYKQCFKRLKAEWEPKLGALGLESLPTDKDAFAALVFARPEYRDRKARDLEAKQL